MLSPQLRQTVQTTIRYLLHALLSEIQQWMTAIRYPPVGSGRPAADHDKFSFRPGQAAAERLAVW
jgi:hypothetical protein